MHRGTFHRIEAHFTASRHISPHRVTFHRIEALFTTPRHISPHRGTQFILRNVHTEKATSHHFNQHYVICSLDCTLDCSLECTLRITVTMPQSACIKVTVCICIRISRDYIYI